MNTDERLVFEREISELKHELKTAKERLLVLEASHKEMKSVAQSKIEELRKLLAKKGKK